jgi:hypothetical protein
MSKKKSVVGDDKYRCSQNSALTEHYGVKEITINVRKMLRKFYWTYLLIWGVSERGDSKLRTDSGKGIKGA